MNLIITPAIVLIVGLAALWGFLGLIEVMCIDTAP